MAGPITLSKQQWLQTAAAKKPQASYKTYLGYIANARKTNPLHPAVNNVMSAFSMGLNPATQAAATSSVNSQIAAQIAANNQASKLLQTQEQNQANRAQGFALALAGLRGDAGTQSQQAYQTAANQIQGYGTGLTGALRDAQQSQAQKVSDQIAAQTGGIGKAAITSPDDLRNTLQYAHVTMPASDLAGRSADAYNQAAGLYDLSGANLGSIAQQYLAKLADTQNTLVGQNATVRASRPKLVQDALSSLSDSQRQQRALDVQVGTLQLQQAKTLADQAIAMTNITNSLHVVRNGKVVDTHASAPGSTAAVAAAKTTAENARAAADRRVRQEIAQAQNTTSISNAQTKAAATKAAAAVRNSPNKPANPAQRSTILKNSQSQGGDLVETTINRIKSLVPNSDDQRTGESVDDFNKRKAQALNVYRNRLKEHRAQIVTRVVNVIAPQLQLLKYGPEQIQAYANAIVSKYIP